MFMFFFINKVASGNNFSGNYFGGGKEGLLALTCIFECCSLAYVMAGKMIFAVVGQLCQLNILILVIGIATKFVYRSNSIAFDVSGTNKIDEESSNASFALPLFWHEVSSLSKKISHHCTKLCLALTKPPMPSESELSGKLF